MAKRDTARNDEGGWIAPLPLRYIQGFGSPQRPVLVFARSVTKCSDAAICRIGKEMSIGKGVIVSVFRDGQLSCEEKEGGQRPEK